MRSAFFITLTAACLIGTSFAVPVPYAELNVEDKLSAGSLSKLARRLIPLDSNSAVSGSGGALDLTEGATSSLLSTTNSVTKPVLNIVDSNTLKLDETSRKVAAGHEAVDSLPNSSDILKPISDTAGGTLDALGKSYGAESSATAPNVEEERKRAEAISEAIDRFNLANTGTTGTTGTTGDKTLARRILNSDSSNAALGGATDKAGGALEEVKSTVDSTTGGLTSGGLNGLTSGDLTGDTLGGLTGGDLTGGALNGLTGGTLNGLTGGTLNKLP
ncbi:hypothetical protein BY458DRAFT_494272 [Sporodiniella umbellata]|nr:hypothetical protein BY458DRAFT_494272 [Sporodiniella umbellata]